MFDVWAFRGIEAVVSSGLGGGSLIYANVLLRKDPAWFQDDYPGVAPRPWPVTYQDLEPHYEAAEAMLGAARYPFDTEPYSSSSKTAATRDAAQRLGLDWQLPPLAVSFASPGRAPAPGEPLEEKEPNMHGLSRRTCTLCGECDVGCNLGAKNTVDLTYLSRAKDAGADIRPLCEVKRIEPADPGFVIHYKQHHPDERAGDGVARTVRAARLILGAGTFGTTYLLLRNRSAFPSLSPALGTRFSGNGDLLTFLRSASRIVEGHKLPRPLDPEFGPVITSAIRMPDTFDGTGDVGRGFYIEDGGNPNFLDWLVQAGSAPRLTFSAGRFGFRRLLAHLRGQPRSNISRDISGLLGNGSPSAETLPMLCMGRDVPNGRFSLRDGNLELDWNTFGSEAYFNRVERTMSDIAAELGAKVANTPLWLFKRVITVHPLGGVPMGSGPDDGVADSFGEVFGYPGLQVVDGSILPGPVGPNPSLTIAALAERAAARILGRTPT
jgi:cholesterol oxidase